MPESVEWNRVVSEPPAQTSGPMAATARKMIGFDFASALSLAAVLARDDFIANWRLGSAESSGALLTSTVCQVLPSSNDRCKPPAALIAQRADSGTREPEVEKLLVEVS